MSYCCFTLLISELCNVASEVAGGIYVYLVVSADGKASKVGKLSVIR